MIIEIHNTEQNFISKKDSEGRTQKAGKRNTKFIYNLKNIYIQNTKPNPHRRNSKCTN